MTKSLDSFSTLLTMLTNTFLLEEGLQQPSHEKMQKAVENHQNSFTSLKKDLGEAKSEWFYGGPGTRRRSDRTGEGSLSASLVGSATLTREYDSREAYEDAVDSLNRLAQHLNGLRSGTRLQYELTKAGVAGGRWKKNKTGGGSKNGKNKIMEAEGEDVEETAMLKAAAAMFGDLVDDLGPPLKALSVSLLCSPLTLNIVMITDYSSIDNMYILP
jgi:hypothetical protein